MGSRCSGAGLPRVTSFLFGRDWITASFWQDWYGIIPLLVGSIMVSIVALAIAVPFGVASAIYVSEIAFPAEKRLIKPYVEFIAAIPSVVLGFFGIAVVGETIRQLSQSRFFHWVGFFPISERLNVFTAGSLLALMAVPTIFTLAEDALRNVPRGFKEASYALGANRLQTIGRVSCRPPFPGSCRLFCSDSAVSSARPWWCCFAPETGSPFPISRKDWAHFSNQSTP